MSTTRLQRTQARDELLRMRAFLVLSGVLAGLGGLATLAVPGDPAFRSAFLAGVFVMLVAYTWFGLHIRDESNYSSAKAATVVAICNLTGVLACLFYGMWSPAPVVLMMPIMFFGLLRSTRAALAAYAVLAGAQAVVQLLILLDVVADPGLLSVDLLSPGMGWLYACLTHLVYAMSYAFARASYSASTQALAEAQGLRLDRDRDAAAREEAEALLDEAKGALNEGPLTGQDVGGWRLGGVLGRGATGVIYACERDAVRGAAKMLTRGEHQHLFEREADVVARLESPHVVRILDVLEGPTTGIVMERLDGEDLGRRLRRRPMLPVPEVRTLVQHVALALDAARERGIVHRDIKPSNLFAAGDTWKVLDFGISKYEGYDATLTQGLLMGTPGYMAPEQTKAQPVSQRTDVFALATVAYRALTGVPPFRGRDQAWMVQVLYDMPRRPGEWTELPEQIDAVLALGLAKDPSQRPTALRFAALFEQAIDGRLDTRSLEQARHLLTAHPWGTRLLPPEDQPSV
ncbi:MAG: serine/threonine protein kinase [Proteobacteria bacterium]|nr:serine/threonine protein kinase [Pseudomonadota bacterium]